MIAAGLVDLFVRMVTSLALVLAIVAVAYVVMRRRAGMTMRTPRLSASAPAASRRGERPPRTGRRNNRQAIEVVGRVGLSRASAAVAIKFGDRVILVGASEQSPPTVLAEVDAATWELGDPGAEWSVPAEFVEPSDQRALTRPGLIDSLREATVRRA